MLYKIRMFIETLIGVPAFDKIESRIFNAVSLFIAVVLLLNAVINCALGLPLLAVLTLAAAIFSYWLYHISHARKKLDLAIMLFGLIGNAFLTLNFYYNSGINGPTLLIFVLLCFLLMAISPKKQHAFWLIVNGSIVCMLLIGSYYYPNLIKNNYPNRFDLFADFGYSYIVVMVLIGLIMVYFKNTYNQQKTLLEDNAKQLQEANQTRDKLLSIIAHDLRSPLASIQNYLEILNEYKFTDEEKKTMELELLSKTKNTDQLLSNLLYWSMNQMNGVKVHLINLNLKTATAPVLQIIDVVAREKGIEIDDLLPPDIMLIADQDMLQLLVRNLVNNAVKFTPAGGKITVSCQLENGLCKVMISDNGVGIPEKIQPAIFSLKTDSTYGTKQEKGTGLGLVLCKEFAELQNGTIGFESTQNVGTTFYFRLQTAEKPRTPEPASIKSGHNTKPASLGNASFIALNTSPNHHGILL